MRLEASAATEIVRLGAIDLAGRILAEEVKTVEVVEAYIGRIEEVNPQLNAIVIPLFDQAHARAIAADEALRKGEEVGPLHGVPVTIKEQYRVRGTQTTLGASKQIGNVYDDEGPLVRKLRSAGAIVLGKTNIIQTLAGWESDNPVYGRSNNPWNLDRTPGGSSGGEAAIIAACGSALGLAGDFGGSTRVPSHFCGVHGFKPTSRRLSNDDFATGLLGTGQETFIPQPGPIARSVADLELAMRLFAETSMHSTNDIVPPVPWQDPGQIDVAGLRVGMYTDNGFFAASPGVAHAVEDAADTLRSMGAAVAAVSPPDAEEGLRIFLRAASAGGIKHYQDLLGSEKPIPAVEGMFKSAKMPSAMAPIVTKVMEARGQAHLARLIRSSHASSAQAYFEIVEARNAYVAAFTDSLDRGGFDAVICPPVALPAFTHGTSQHLFAAASYAFVYNVLGAPAGVVAITRVRPDEESSHDPGKDITDITAKQVEEGSAGLPLGVQVVARHWRDDVVLAVMAALEGHFRKSPDYPSIDHLA